MTSLFQQAICRQGSFPLLPFNHFNNGAARFAILSLLMLFVFSCQKPVNENLNKSEAAKRHIQVALANIDEGDTRRALTHLQRAESFESRSVDLFNGYALLHRAEGDAKREELYYKKALRVSKNDARTKNNYGSFLCFHERPKQGLKMLEEVTNDYAYQARAEAFVNKAMCELTLGKNDDAEKSFQQALRLSANSLRPYIELADLYFQKNDFRTAGMYYQQYVSRVAQQPPRALWLGIQLAQQSNDQNTVASYGLQLEKIFPNSPEYQRYLLIRKK